MRQCYFAAYEIQMGDQLKVWGQTTLVHEVDEHAGLQPDRLLARVQEQVADQHGVWPTEVHISALTRLD